jgi:S-methylmethionine-dependent homocysteine/selenocysteine methylase
MDIQKLLDDHDFILTEAAVIETLRRSATVALHPRLENALLIYEEKGRKALSNLYHGFVDVAHRRGVPILVCTPTWRANQERTLAANCSDALNEDAVRFIEQFRQGWGSWVSNILIGGLIGCKNDCYRPDEALSVADAKVFHGWQIDRLARAGADFLLGATLPALSEATGIALAMAQRDIPYIISFVIGRTGKVLDGSSLEHAFRKIDTACGRPPLGYMINCAYPAFLNVHSQPRSVLSRLIGYQANASSLDHAQLEGAETVQVDDISHWGDLMVELNRKFGIKILGGCCGTSDEHLDYISRKIAHG